MAEIQIDDDWKKQAQEEKRRLAEQQKQREAAAKPAVTTSSAAKKPRETPAADFDSLVQQMMTQALYYLGELSEDPNAGVDVDGAKYQIDLLTTLELKTQGNLTPDEQKFIDSALYDLRMRYVSLATQSIR